MAEEIQNYEYECVDFLLLSNGRHVLDVSYNTTIHCLVEDKVWSTISSLVWLMLLYTLRSQYEAITSEPDVVFRKQQHFREMWKKAKAFTSFGERIK